MGDSSLESALLGLVCLAAVLTWLVFFVYAIAKGLTSTSEPTKPEGFRCPFCQSTRGYFLRSRVHPVGWFFFPLGLLLRERWQVCAHCKVKIS